MVVVMMIDSMVSYIFVIAHCPENMRLIVMANISTIDVVACPRKCFVAASIACGLNF